MRVQSLGSRRRLILVALALTLQSCAAHQTAPTARAGLGLPAIARIATPPRTDTIDARPRPSYVLAVTNEDASPAAGASVTFRGTNAEVAVPGEGFGPEATLTADSRGEVAVAVRFGSLAGPAVIEAYVPALQASDTLRLEVSPGRTVGPAITVSDTLVRPGVPVRAQATPADRHGNVTGEPIPLSVESNAFRQEAAGLVATRLGEAHLSATFEGYMHHVTIAAVPDGELAAVRGQSVMRLSLDGTLSQELPVIVRSARERTVDWDTAGRRIVLGEQAGFFIFDLENERLTHASWAHTSIARPTFGPDGLIQFSASSGVPRGEWGIHWAAPDGSEHGATVSLARFPNNDLHPDWHPDASRFVFTADWEERGRYLLRVADTATDSIMTLDVEGTTPTWSPDGSLIAYQQSGTVGVIAPDGSDHRYWNVGWSRGIAWSPDGQALIGIDASIPAVLDISTGEEVVLRHLGMGFQDVDWRPAPGP